MSICTYLLFDLSIRSINQVQRCAEDMSILITTYEGTHNHPLPISATAMASTTSAAASMLMSGSSTSETGPNSTTTAAAATTAANLNGLNFYLSDNSRSKPSFYLPNPSISSSPSFPTITLDLTTSAPSSSSHLNRLGGGGPGGGGFLQRYSSTNLNFSSLESNPNSYNNGMLNYGPQSFNRNQNPPSLSFGSQPYENLYQTYLQKTMSNPNNQQSLGPDTIAAATKAITSDPSFQSVLAAALTSIMGGSGGGAAATLGNPSSGEKSGAITSNKGSDSFPVLSSFPSNPNANKCAPSFMNKSSSSTSSQPAGLTLLSPPFPFPNSSKSKSSSPGDNRDHVN